MRYFLLKSVRDIGKVVKNDGQKNYIYKPEKGWVRSGIMSHYFLPFGIYFEQYEEITEEEANKLILKES